MKGWQWWVPSSSSSEDQHRWGLSQALCKNRTSCLGAPEAGNSWARGSSPGNLLSVYPLGRLPTHFPEPLAGKSGAPSLIPSLEAPWEDGADMLQNAGLV